MRIHTISYPCLSDHPRPYPSTSTVLEYVEIRPGVVVASPSKVLFVFLFLSQLGRGFPAPKLIQWESFNDLTHFFRVHAELIEEGFVLGRESLVQI